MHTSHLLQTDSTLWLLITKGKTNFNKATFIQKIWCEMSGKIEKSFMKKTYYTSNSYIFKHFSKLIILL
jgi:hypothetical protein